MNGSKPYGPSSDQQTSGKALVRFARAHLGTTTKSARKRSAAVCGAPAAAARRGHAFWDHSATLGIRTCCGWSFGHSRGPVVVPRSYLFWKVSFHKNYSREFGIWGADQLEHVGTMLLDFSEVLLGI